MKKNIKLIIGIIIAVVLMLLIGIVVVNSPAKRIKKQLELADKYMLEMDYENAIVAYNKAIQIDEMNVEAYVGKINALLALAGHAEIKEEKQKYLQEALETANTGYNKTGDEGLKQLIDEINKQIETANMDIIFPFELTDIKMAGKTLMDLSLSECRSYGEANYMNTLDAFDAGIRQGWTWYYIEDNNELSFTDISKGGSGNVNISESAGDAASLYRIYSFVYSNTEKQGDPAEFLEAPFKMRQKYDEIVKILGLEDFEIPREQTYYVTNWGKVNLSKGDMENSYDIELMFKYKDCDDVVMSFDFKKDDDELYWFRIDMAYYN